MTSSKRKDNNALEMLCKAAEAEYATTIPVGEEKVKLEARIANQRESDVAVVFCAALPPAGNMYIPEIGFLQAQLARAGYVTVRFNFRGVGGSEGNKYLRSARQEMEDVRDVARWLRAHRNYFKLPPLRATWIVGISYGSVIGSAAAHFPEFDGYVAIAYPSNYLWYCTGFDSRQFWNHAKTAKPKLFVWGETDVFSGKNAMESCFAELPEPKFSATFSELDSFLGHYFRSKRNLNALFAAVHNFLKGRGEKGVPRKLQRKPKKTEEGPSSKHQQQQQQQLEPAPPPVEEPPAEKPKTRRKVGLPFFA
ncbi:hypothetical protein CTAYLR_001118 [Chrysophaeum taylorii]|uniref:Xaa-Pro dipeptidyl-peptidase-like domain-containing protein n=1 Tax=Chrysophaeum taylorii TaxID=2483200 RepID=A0AAD7UQS0_9STRA|nr:hypothetical protein CTAYLR_001118 [Chrysophaeum taylorii]